MPAFSCRLTFTRSRSGVNVRVPIHAGYVSFIQLLRIDVGALPAINWRLVSIDHVVVGITAIVIARAKSRAVPGIIEGLTPHGLAADSTLALAASTRAPHICLTYFQVGTISDTPSPDATTAIVVRSDIDSHEIDGHLLPTDQGANEGSCCVARALRGVAGIPIGCDGRLVHCDHTQAIVVVAVLFA
jgi:hypothetical protein